MRDADRPQLAEEVAAELRGRVLAGELRPGTRIRLEEVAARLGVSITPVREALVTLRAEDMVHREPHRGHVVAPLSRQDVRDLFQVRAGLAAELAARVAARITPDGLDELARADRALARARRPAEIEQRERDFHRLVDRMADSRKLSWFLHAAGRYTTARLCAADIRAAHRELLAAFAARDERAARTVMVRHFAEGADHVVAHLEDRGFWVDAQARRRPVAADRSPRR